MDPLREPGEVRFSGPGVDVDLFVFGRGLGVTKGVGQLRLLRGWRDTDGESVEQGEGERGCWTHLDGPRIDTLTKELIGELVRTVKTQLHDRTRSTHV